MQLGERTEGCSLSEDIATSSGVNVGCTMVLWEAQYFGVMCDGWVVKFGCELGVDICCCCVEYIYCGWDRSIVVLEVLGLDIVEGLEGFVAGTFLSSCYTSLSGNSPSSPSFVCFDCQ